MAIGIKALIVVVAIASPFTTYAGSAEDDEIANNIRTEFASLKSDNERRQFREQLAKAIVLQASPTLPKKINDFVTWIEMKFSGSGLVYIYQTTDRFAEQLKNPQKSARFAENMKGMHSDDVCHNPVMRVLVEIKSPLRFEYRDSSERNVIAPVTVNSCKK